MNTTVQLSDTKKKLYKTLSMDGIGDITIGFLLMCLGGQFYLDSPAFLFFMIMAGPVAVMLKKKITYPRIGYYKFTPGNTSGGNSAGKTALLFCLIGMIAAGIAKAVGISFPDIIEQHLVISIGVVLSVFASLIAYKTGIRRVYLYALAGLLIFIDLHFSGLLHSTDKVSLLHALGIYSFILGIVVTVTGIILLIRFIRNYPIEELEAEPQD